MEELLKLGINTDSLKHILEINNEIIDLTEKEIQDKINLLYQLNCSEKIIKNIIESNPMYLSRSNNDLIKLINKLNDLGITRLDITFDNNPFLLDYDAFEIDKFIEKKTKQGIKMEDILDLIDLGRVD